MDGSQTTPLPSTMTSVLTDAVAATPLAPPTAASAPAGAAATARSRTGQTPAASREQTQLTKLREANAKYKNLLMLAKERIQEQEVLMDERRCE
jgi:hypothetical protein